MNHLFLVAAVKEAGGNIDSQWEAEQNIENVMHIRRQILTLYHS